MLFSDPILTEAIQNACDAGLLVCIAAANDAKDDDTYRLSIAGLRATVSDRPSQAGVEPRLWGTFTFE